jgi:hypothetical protein
MSSIDSVRKEIRPWVSPNGERRYYIDDWWTLVGGILESYSSGDWTAARVPEMKRARVWFDEDARVHVDHLKDMVAVDIIIGTIESQFYLRVGTLIILRRILCPKAIPC